MALNEHDPRSAFPGTISRTADESTPLRPGRSAALRPQLPGSRPVPGLHTGAPVARGPTSCASSSSRPASRTSGTVVAPPVRMQLYVDKTLVAENDAPVTIPFAVDPGALSCGHNPGPPVTPDYTSPFRFTGTLHEVVIDVSGDLITDSESQVRMAMSRQ